MGNYTSYYGWCLNLVLWQLYYSSEKGSNGSYSDSISLESCLNVLLDDSCSLESSLDLLTPDSEIFDESESIVVFSELSLAVWSSG